MRSGLASPPQAALRNYSILTACTSVTWYDMRVEVTYSARLAAPRQVTSGNRHKMFRGVIDVSPIPPLPHGVRLAHA